MNDCRKPSYYAIIPATVRYDKRLKFAERLLYGEITSLVGKEGYCFASNNYFAELYGVISGTISRWISNLNKLGYIEVELIVNDKKEIVERRIYIIDLSYRSSLINTYEQNSLYPYKQNKAYPISKKAKDNNINIKIDRLFNYIINNSEDFPEGFINKAHYMEFYEVLKRLEFNYTKDILKIIEEENINKLKVIIYCIREIFLSDKRNLLLKTTRQNLIEIYDNCKDFEKNYNGTEKEIQNFFNYYYSSVLKDLKAK